MCLLLMLIVHAQMKIDPLMQDHMERQFCPLSKKASVELRKCNLLCFAMLYLKYFTNVINALKELNIAAGQYAPLKTCECFTLQL